MTAPRALEPFLLERCVELRERGYTSLPSQLSTPEVHALGEIADRALAAVRVAVAAGRPVPFSSGIDEYQAASSLYCWGEAALALLDHPTVHAVGTELLGDYLLNDLTVFSIPPAVGRERVRTTSWHRDCPLVLDNDLPGHLWFLFPLDELRADNGATWVVPHSHRHDSGPLRAPWVELDRERFPERERLLLRAGDLAVLDARTVHSSDRNDSDRPRRLLNLGLVHPELRARVRVNHVRIAGADILERVPSRVRRLLGDRWPDRPSTGPGPVLPMNGPVGHERVG